MTQSKLVYFLVIIFGSSSWMGTNSIWMQLPLLVSDLPEGWKLPSYLATVVQIACIGPLIYSFLHKGCRSFTLPTVALIIFFLCLACLCQLGLVFFWMDTIAIGSKKYSILLYLLLFGLALVNALSNVLFMPFMAQFHHKYLNAYFVGMGFSSLVPSCLSLIQGTSSYVCSADGTATDLPPKFSVSVFFFIIFLWTCSALACFLVMYRMDAHIHHKEEKPEAHESTPLNEGEKEAPVKQRTRGDLSKATFTFILLATALVNAQMNGIIPSIQSYAALPYSQETYHYGIALANVVSPLASFLSFFVTIRCIKILATLTFTSSLMTAFIIYLAVLSPNLVFNSSRIGSLFSIGSALIAAGLHSYLRVIFASRMREGQQSEDRLFWCGVFIQIGSFVGSAIMFPLVNIVHVFQQAPRCS